MIWKRASIWTTSASTKAVARAPVNYLREDGTLLRRSTFPGQTPFTRDNFETGAYFQDRWLALPGLLIEPGLRFDWDEIIRRPTLSPRLAATWSPPAAEATTKLSAGIGLYYEHTQLEYLERALAGVRFDTYYAADGVTPVSGSLETIFAANDSSLRQTRSHQLERWHPEKASRLDLRRGKFPAEANLRRFRLRQSTRVRSAVWALSANQRPAGSLCFRGVRPEPHVCQWIQAVWRLYAFLGPYQCGPRLYAHGLAAWPPAECSAALGCAQSRNFLGMAALAAPQAKEELGFRVHP